MKIAYIALKGMQVTGGIEKCTEEIGSRLAKNGHEIIVYTTKHYAVSDEKMFKGMSIKTVPSIRRKSLEKITATFMATLSLCLEKDVDVVHFHAFGPSMFCFIPRLMGRKVIVQGHGLEWKRAKWNGLGKLFLKLAEIPSVLFPHIVTVDGITQKKYVMEKYGRKCIFIPNGISPPKIEKPDLIKQYGLRGNDYIFFAARLVREKGAQYLIEAYKQLKTNIKLVIAGDAEYEDVYKAELYKLADGNKNIIFTGSVRGKMLSELFSNCYLFVLPSEIEGLPTVLLEAMSYGNCCLISDIPENLAVLGKLGYSFKSKDIYKLAEKLRLLLNNREAVESVKDKAKNHALENYSWDSTAKQYEELYEKLALQ